MSFSEIGRKYEKHINRARPDQFISKHMRFGHVGKEPEGRLPPDPASMTGQKVERHRKSIDERIDELYQLALDGCKMAADDRKARDLAACIAQGIAATALMGKPSDSEDKPSSGLAEMREALRNGLATAPTQ